MSGYEVIFLLAALTVFALAVVGGDRRGSVWVALIMLNVALCDGYMQLGLPWSDAFMAGCDLALCFALNYAGARRWELWLWLTYLVSACVSILHFAAGFLATDMIAQEDYLTVLEALNYIAIITVGGVSGFVIVGRQDISALRPWRRRGILVHPLYRAGAGD